MNDYRQRVNVNKRLEPSIASMGKFFSNRLRDSLQLGGTLPTTTTTTRVQDTFDQTTPDYEATPEPPAGSTDFRQTMVTPLSITADNTDSYFTQTSRDIHKFSHRVELSSGYNILKNRTSSRPTRLPTFLQGRTPLAQLNPLPATAAITSKDLDDNRQRRLSFTDHHRMQTLAHSQKVLQQFNIDGTRRPFSSDSPIPSSLPLPPAATFISPYTSSAPAIHNRNAYEPIEPLKLPVEQEDNSIAALSRELRAVAYPTSRKLPNHSPTRESSPPTTRYTSRTNTKRGPPRSLPKLHTHEQQTPMSHGRSSLSTHVHPVDKSPSIPDDRLHSTSNGTLLLDQFFTSAETPRRELPAPLHEVIPPPTAPSSGSLMRTPSITNANDDATTVSKYVRLASIVAVQAEASNGHSPNDTSVNEFTHQLDTLHDASSFDEEHIPLTDDVFSTAGLTMHSNTTSDTAMENYSYIPLKEDMKSMHGIPLLELDELETSSDISESQLVPIIYAKDLANEIDLLQKAHLLKQQQRFTATTDNDDRANDTSSVPPPDDMELLNFEALEEEFFSTYQHEKTPVPSPTIRSTTMEISPPPPPEASGPSSPLYTEMDTSVASLLEHTILTHNRSSSWFKLPTELWFRILPHLNSSDLHHFSLVCKRFYLLAQDQACHHRVTLHRRMNIEQLWLDAIKRRKPVSLSLIECRQQALENNQDPTDDTANAVDWLSFFQCIGSTLLDFTMTGCYHEPCTPNTLLPILAQTCSRLLSLNLRWNHITESTLNHLSTYQQFLHLQTLDLTGCQILDDTILINMFIRAETNFQLTKLVLHACPNITWISLETIAICIPNLRHLNISRCFGLRNLSSNQNGTCFSHWPELQSLDVGNLLALSNDDFAVILDRCKLLTTVILDQCIQLTDQTVNQLSSDLRVLSLAGCTNISTALLSDLNERYPRLYKIDLTSVKSVNDICLIKWATKPFAELETLVLDHCTDCTLSGIERFLAAHVHLRELSLDGHAISDVIEQTNLQQSFSRTNIVFQKITS